MRVTKDQRDGMQKVSLNNYLIIRLLNITMVSMLLGSLKCKVPNK